MPNKAATGGGGPSNTKWAYFANNFFQYSSTDGRKLRISAEKFNDLPDATKDRLRRTADFKHVQKGGLWTRVGSPRWQREKGIGRVPVRMVKAPSTRGKPPVGPNDPKFTNWLQTGNPNKAGRDASKTGAAGDGTKSGEDVVRGKGGAPPGTNGLPRGAGGGGGGGKGGNYSKLYKSLMTQLGGGKVGQKIPRSYADALAGMIYDPQIHDLKAEMDRQPAQAAQNLADINNWYGQAQDMFAQAGDRNQALVNQVAQSNQDTAQSLMASLGLGGTGAGGVLAAQGADASAMVRSLGAAQQMYQNDMGPLLAQEQAGAKRVQDAQATQQHQDLALQLADLFGQRGQAKTKAIMDIVQANNALAQTRFGNKLSSQQAAASIASLIPDLKLKQAQLQGQQLQNAGNAQALRAAGASGGGDRAPLSSMNPYEVSQFMDSIISKPDGTLRSFAQAKALLRSQGYKTAYAERVLRSTLNGMS